MEYREKRPLLSIVIPAFNEELRLPKTLKTLFQLELESALDFELLEVIISDDGSTDGTQQMINSLHLDRLKFVGYKKNIGKGRAVHFGYQNVSPKAQWILMADADMATPWLEMNKLLDVSKNTQAGLLFGSRDLSDSKVVVSQSWVREYLGKSFNVFVRLLTGLPFKDTQCGFKLLRRDAFDKIVNELKIDDFAWDVELILVALKHNIVCQEVPVEWYHVKESRVKLFRHGLKMALTVFILRMQHIFLKRGAE